MAFSERVAHLSWKRSEFTAAEQLVLTHEIEGELRSLILRFLHAADPAALCEDFGEEARLAVNAARPGQVALSLAELGYRSPVGTQAITTIGGTATQALSESAEQFPPPS